MLIPGAELDLKVTQTCGMKIEQHLGREKFVCDKYVSGHWVYSKHFQQNEGDPCACEYFRPSIDLNDAFFAAEKVGLFDSSHLAKGASGWGVRDYDSGTGCNELSSDESTPALAICAAILKLRNGE
jgi:hypothetical protein